MNFFLIEVKKLFERGNFDLWFILADVQELFPSRDLSKSSLTVITISHRTSHDMSGWSQDVEEEREGLLAAVSCLWPQAHVYLIQM